MFSHVIGSFVDQYLPQRVTSQLFSLSFETTARSILIVINHLVSLDEIHERPLALTCFCKCRSQPPTVSMNAAHVLVLSAIFLNLTNGAYRTFCFEFDVTSTEQGGVWEVLIMDIEVIPLFRRAIRFWGCFAVLRYSCVYNVVYQYRICFCVAVHRTLYGHWN